MDDAFLDRQFYEQWLGLGSLNFLVERVQPFARALSGCRQRGEIGAAEERFGNEKLGDFLSTVWRRLNENNTESPVLLSTLPDDPQSIGSQVAAVVMALAGLRVIYLGPAAALDDLISAAQRQKVQGVLLSVALDRDPVLTAKHLAYLRVGLPPEAFLAVSGVLAAPAGPEIQCFSELPGLFQWARKWAPGHSARGFR
jgi:methylmalonyl-CoA mutase cobalamin-binding subunit